MTYGQDETNFARILSTVEKYAGRRSGETWAELESRSNYKELVSESRGKTTTTREYVWQAADMGDVHNLISRLMATNRGETDLPAHLFLIAPKIDFRQSSAPNFLTDS